MQTIAFLGGSFDPVHNGHLWMANAVSHTIDCTLKFMPTPRSPIKQTQTSSKHRLAMLKLACRNTSYHIERTELYGPSPASSIETFAALRNHYGHECTFIFIIGQDNFETLHEWRGGFNLLNLTHLWVFPRTQTQRDNQPLIVPDPLKKHQIFETDALETRTEGFIFLDSRIPPHVSSTQIRGQLSAHKHLVPPRVFAYSERTNLYQE